MVCFTALNNLINILACRSGGNFFIADNDTRTRIFRTPVLSPRTQCVFIQSTVPLFGTDASDITTHSVNAMLFSSTLGGFVFLGNITSENTPIELPQIDVVATDGTKTSYTMVYNTSLGAGYVLNGLVYMNGVLYTIARNNVTNESFVGIITLNTPANTFTISLSNISALTSTETVVTIAPRCSAKNLVYAIYNDSSTKLNYFATINLTTQNVSKLVNEPVGVNPANYTLFGGCPLYGTIRGDPVLPEGVYLYNDVDLPKV